MTHHPIGGVFSAPLLACICLAAPTTAQGNFEKSDLVTLEDGAEIECRVLFEGEDKVIVAAKKRQEIPVADIESIESVERKMRIYLKRFDELDTSDAAAIADLARWCEEHDLRGEAYNTWVRVIGADREHKAAWESIGGVYSKKKGWRVKVRSRVVTP